MRFNKPKLKRNVGVAAAPSEEYIGFDFEALGLSPSTDHATQAGFVRLSGSIEPENSLEVNIALSDYSVPGPRALEVTELTMEALKASDRISEYEASCQAVEFLKHRPAGTTRIFAGYNSLRFDDELLRAFLFRNLHDPYIASGRGVSKVDLFPALQLLDFIRPGTILPGQSEEGQRSWKLQDVLDANDLSRTVKHAALEDTLGLAGLLKLYKQKAPDVLKALVSKSNKASIMNLLEMNLGASNFLLHFSQFGEPDFAPLAPMVQHGAGDGSFLCVDLRYDPEDWMQADAVELANIIFSEDSPLRVVRANTCPMIFSPADPILKDGIGAQPLLEAKADCAEMAKSVRNDEIMNKLKLVTQELERQREVMFGGTSITSEKAIYDSFVSREDKDLCAQFHKAGDWYEKAKIAGEFSDLRLIDFASRLIAMHGPDDVQTPSTLAALKKQVDLRLSSSEEVMNEVQTIASARSSLDTITSDGIRTQMSEMLDQAEADLERRSELLDQRIAAFSTSPRP